MSFRNSLSIDIGLPCPPLSAKALSKKLSSANIISILFETIFFSLCKSKEEIISSTKSNNLEPLLNPEWIANCSNLFFDYLFLIFFLITEGKNIDIALE